MKFRIVIWNLKGLSNVSDPSRLQRAKVAFRIMADENDTAAFALVELGPEPNSVLEDLARHLGDEWKHFFGGVRSQNGEIGLLLNPERLSATTIRSSTLPHYISNGKDIKIGREPVALYLVKHNDISSFMLAIVHFKAEGGGSEAYTRKALALWLKEELETFYKDTSLPIVIVGDFNGEPWEEMFGKDGFSRLQAYGRDVSQSRKSKTIQPNVEATPRSVHRFRTPFK